MNLLKALAKMTRYAAHLQHCEDVLQARLAVLQEKYDDTVRIATDRDTQIKQLQAKLHAAEQNVGDVTKRCNAVDKLNELGYVWSIPDSRWFDPVPKPPIGVPVARAAQVVRSEPTEYPTLPPKPEGSHWRDCSKANPRDMGEVIEAVLFNGDRVTAPAVEMEWSSDLSVGVAWWRFPL